MKIAFCDFWGTFDPYDNYFYHLVRTHHNGDVVIDYNNPDVVFYSVFGESHKKWTGKCSKIRFSGESPLESDYTEHCNLSLSFQSGGPKQYRLPLWVTYIDWFSTGNSTLVDYYSLTIDRSLPAKNTHPNNFCNFIYNNPAEGSPRIHLFNELSKYRLVHSYGRLLNNMGILGGNEASKRMVQKQYRFSLALENTQSPGYVTEKLLHALQARTYPIYWGDAQSKIDFNPNAFLFINDAFVYTTDWSRFIASIDNDKCINRALKEPIFPNNKINQSFMPESVWKEIKKCLPV